MFINFISLLKTEMSEPAPFGWFHLLWIALTLFTIYILYTKKNTHSEKQLKWVLGTYGIITLVLEVLKQLSWSFNYDVTTQLITWDYQWYAFPFQLCTTPLFVSIIALFLKKNKVRDALLSYMAFITILGGVMTILIPDSCFVDEVLINIHTMYLHCGSVVVSIYLLVSKEVEINLTSLKNAFFVFLGFVCIANTLNILIYNSGILRGEEFNMFYISPYFISSLPVFNTIQQNVPYILYLFLYILAIFLGSCIVYGICILIKKFNNKNS